MQPVGLFKTFNDDLMSHAMDGHYARQQAITSNVANVETPGYGRRDVAFESSLKNALGQHRLSNRNKNSSFNLSSNGDLALSGNAALHYESSGVLNNESGLWKPFETTEDTAHQGRNDGNSVDVETEMVQLAKNSSTFKSLTTLQARSNQMLRTLLQQAGQV